MAEPTGPTSQSRPPAPTGTAPAPTEATATSDAPSADRSPGWREVLIVGVVVVVIVLGLAFATSALPASLQDVVFRTPLAIVVLLVGTVGLMLWVARRPAH